MYQSSFREHGGSGPLPKLQSLYIVFVLLRELPSSMMLTSISTALTLASLAQAQSPNYLITLYAENREKHGNVGQMLSI